MIKIYQSLIHTSSHICITNVRTWIYYTRKENKWTFQQMIGSFYSCCKPPATPHNKTPRIFYYDPSKFLKFLPISARENTKLPGNDPPGNLIWESVYYSCLLFLIIWFLLYDNFSQKNRNLLLHHTIKIVKKSSKKTFRFLCHIPTLKIMRKCMATSVLI
jgi:hypothetical protein